MDKRISGLMHYYEEQYKETILDMRFAKAVGDKHMVERCNDDLRRISNLACKTVGFQFADALRHKYIKEGDYVC